MLPLLVAGILDLVVLVAFIIVDATVGKPLSTLSCESLPEAGAPAASSFFTFVTGYGYQTSATRYQGYLQLIAVDQPHCYEIKAVWGLGIALTVLFSFSALVCVGLWHRIRRASGGAPTKDVENH